MAMACLPTSDYNSNVDVFREATYPMLKDAIYLDHAGTTLYAKTLMEQFASDMISNLYGNPHSASPSSQLSTSRIQDIRLKVLQFFKADPEDFDVVFVANATAGMKLVIDAFQGLKEGFLYGYHQDSHTSMVGARETATVSRCFSDLDVEEWLGAHEPFIKTSNPVTGLFAYPAQSNMNGRRLPLSWLGRIRDTAAATAQPCYTLLDAAALVSTSQLDLSDASNAPDFTVLSFNKIFGFPDLGALLVRKESGQILRSRKYFGGGTVDTVVCIKEQWHILKDENLHGTLEDGTLPIHNIMALETAMKVHNELYGSMDRISRHTLFLARKLFNSLKALRHANGEPVCELYCREEEFCAGKSGPIVTFNMKSSHRAWISNPEVEKLATIRNINIRTGSLCNPGGVAEVLGLEPWEMKRNFSAGFRCGNENGVMGGKPTGVIRTSLGAMSNMDDIDRFIAFIEEFYVETKINNVDEPLPEIPEEKSGLFVESLTIYPIKSCGGLAIPPNTDWEVKQEGLAWDREWCLVHRGTGQALSQKRHPRMALIRPLIDFEAGMLRITFHGTMKEGHGENKEIQVPLSADPAFYEPVDGLRPLSSRVCGDAIIAYTYSSKSINDFFTRALGVPCALARFPAGGTGPSTRHSKAHMQRHQRPKRSSPIDPEIVPGAFPTPPTPPDSDSEGSTLPILLSNESPILAISRSSINALNQEIVKNGGKPASASVFRANIVIASSLPIENQQPYSEDHWSSLRIGKQEFKMLGSCRRCHMICVDQDTAVKNEEPFVTLAKTRRFEGKVFFGSHMCQQKATGILTRGRQYPTIRVGDIVT